MTDTLDNQNGHFQEFSIFLSEVSCAVAGGGRHSLYRLRIFLAFFFQILSVLVTFLEQTLRIGGFFFCTTKESQGQSNRIEEKFVRSTQIFPCLVQHYPFDHTDSTTPVCVCVYVHSKLLVIVFH